MKTICFGQTDMKIVKQGSNQLLIIGTRMWRRGANLEGDTANFIETEQLLEFEGFKSSLLQVVSTGIISS